MNPVLAGALAGGALGVLAEWPRRILPGRSPEAEAQPGWTQTVSRPPFLQVLGVVVGAICGLKFGLTRELVLALALVAILLPVIAIDLEYRIIPNLLVVPGAAVGIVLTALLFPDRILEHAIAAVATFGVLFAIAVIKPGGFGFGDVKLGLALGAFMGGRVASGVFAAFLLASIPSIILLLTRGRDGARTYVPFGPFLAAGAVIALLLAKPLIDFGGGA